MAKIKDILRQELGPMGKLKYTLDDLEKDEKFQEIAERFLESVGENSDDIFEYLRDSDFNLVSGMSRAMQSGKFTDQQKQDYAYLRRTFDKADMGSMKQYAELIKDGAIDMVSDPFTIAAALAAPFTGGTSLAARQGLATVALQGSKAVAANKLKDVAAKQIGKATAASAAIGGSWTGLDNHFRQNTELNTGLRKMYSNGELLGSTALGAVTGGVFGNLAQKNALYNSRLSRLYSNDEYRKAADVFLGFNVRKAIDAGLAKVGGSAASILNTIAEVSPTAKKLGQTFVDDFEKKIAGPRATRRIGYSFAEDLDNRRGGYIQGLDAALAPIRKTGDIAEVDGIAVLRILRGAKPEKSQGKIFLNGEEISKEAVASARKLKKVFDSVYKHAEKANMAPNYVETFFPRSWNRQAIKDNTAEFKQLLLKEGNLTAGQKKNIDEIIEGMIDKGNELYASHSNLLGQSRIFQNLPDNKFEQFLTNDIVEVSADYLLNAARSIEIKKKFLARGKPFKVIGETPEGDLKLYRQSLQEQFRERYIEPIRREVREAGGKFTGNDEKRVLELFDSVTGNVHYWGETIQGLYDGLKLANSMAYLPLATLSSVTEAMIPLAKAKPSSAVKGAFKGVQGGMSIFGKEMGQILKDKYKMSDNQLVKEMNRVWIAVDESIGDVTNRLAGEGLQNEFTKRMAKGFFRFNLLIPWTKTVQLASFSTGKDLIFDNLTKLNNLSKQGVKVLDEDAMIRQSLKTVDDKSRLKGILDSVAVTGKKDNLRKINQLKSELFELGIDVGEGLKWLERGAKQKDNFYNQVVRGAGRFTNSVILQTGRERAKVPTYMSNPKLDILTQFLRYPYVFSNTVLKNFARDAIQNPGVNAPRVAAFGLMATNVALATNYWRSNEDYRNKIDKEGLTNRDVVKALQRTGMAGPIDMGIRWGEATQYGKNPLLAASSLGGPVIGDIVNSAFYNRGLLETAARKLPLYGSKNLIERYTGFDFDDVAKAAREIDRPMLEGLKTGLQALTFPEEEKGTGLTSGLTTLRRNYFEGGEVSKNVSDVKDNPENRVDPLTGLPYSVQSEITIDTFKKESFDEEMERLGFQTGGVVNIPNNETQPLLESNDNKFKMKFKSNTFTESEREEAFDNLVNVLDNFDT